MEVTVGGDRKSGFNYIDTQPVEFMCHTNLFRRSHAAAGRLLSIAQSGVEYLYVLADRHNNPPDPRKSLCLQNQKGPSFGG
jgi:hypothetical protein